MASLHGWSVASWDVSTAFLNAYLPEGQEVYCRPPNVLVRLGLAQPGIVSKLKRALYGLQTSRKAWEEERDQKLGQLQWGYTTRKGWSGQGRKRKLCVRPKARVKTRRAKIPSAKARAKGQTARAGVLLPVGLLLLRDRQILGQ